MSTNYKVFKDDEDGYTAWLKQNRDGFVLNTRRPPRTTYMPVHTARCRTINDPAPHPFTGHGYMKVCANDPKDLLVWMAEHGADKFSHLCSKCNVADLMGGAATSTADGTGNEWSERELRASVQAYLEMQRKEHAQQPFSKSECYAALSKQFGRTAKAFEYRMQNISYVLSLMGRERLTGLKPAKNVGKKVATQIEALVLELSQSAQPPVVSFEMEVRENLENKNLSEPTGSKQPETTISLVVQYKRDPLVKAWVLKQADGVCECCGKDAPFKTPDGQSFLEVHHVHELSGKGPDTISNAVAICPNCHRALHYGMEAKELKERLYTKIPRLRKEKITR